MSDSSEYTKKLTLGQKIKSYRERLGLSQFNLEIEAGMQAGSICRIEKGVINPSKETLFKLAKALHLTQLEIADLFEIDVLRYLHVSKDESQIK